MKFRNYIPIKVKTHLDIDEAELQRSDPNDEIINHNTCDSPKCPTKQDGRGTKSTPTDYIHSEMLAI